MCLIFFSINNHPNYKLIVAANRDEFYNRSTEPANFWTDHKDVLGGRDLEAGGTWLGITKKGKVSLITNYRDPANINPNAPSRGQLVSDYLIDASIDSEIYLQHIREKQNLYNGFNLIVGNANELNYLSNYGDGIKKITSGFYGLSNHLLETPWPKVLRGKNKLQSVIDKPSVSVENVFDVLYDSERAVDDQLPDTGMGLERERALSSMFIKSPGYGTRCSTVILIDKLDQVYFAERVYDLETYEYTTCSYEFKIQSK